MKFFVKYEKTHYGKEDELIQDAKIVELDSNLPAEEMTKQLYGLLSDMPLDDVQIISFSKAE